MSQEKRLTTGNGSPVPHDDTSRSMGPQGPLGMDNVHLFEKLAHFNRERIPERVVHARGTGAHGVFRLTRDLSKYTIADCLRGEGKETEVFARFSTVGGGQDSSDFARDPRGFALKFYSAEGNWDLVGNNTPVFFLRDPIKFPDFVHSQKKNPRSNMPDPAAMYEFWANSPQSLHQVTILMSDRGIPASYRHMNGYASHTLSFWNNEGVRTWVKWHFKTNQGIKCLTNTEAAGMPSHGGQQDLVEAIDRGDFPSWNVNIQVMTEEQARHAKFNVFDVTKVWSHADYPLIKVGTLTLNRNVSNYFAETEQAAFSPSHLVPGVGVSPDRMLQGRLMAYPDAHRYRLGANYQDIPINAPRCDVNHYQRDGQFAGTGRSADSSVNFFPNDQGSSGAPRPSATTEEPPFPSEQQAALAWYDNRDEDNFSQAGDLFRIMNKDQQGQLFNNIASGLVHAADSVQVRMLEQFERADPAYAAGVKAALRVSAN
ncbi:MAG: catalase [Planctomycetota bacterium]